MRRVRGASGDVLARGPGFSPDIDIAPRAPPSAPVPTSEILEWAKHTALLKHSLPSAGSRPHRRLGASRGGGGGGVARHPPRWPTGRRRPPRSQTPRSAGDHGKVGGEMEQATSTADPKALEGGSPPGGQQKSGGLKVRDALMVSRLAPAGGPRAAPVPPLGRRGGKNWPSGRSASSEAPPPPPPPPQVCVWGGHPCPPPRKSPRPPPRWAPSQARGPNATAAAEEGEGSPPAPRRELSPRPAPVFGHGSPAPPRPGGVTADVRTDSSWWGAVTSPPPPPPAEKPDGAEEPEGPAARGAGRPGRRRGREGGREPHAGAQAEAVERGWLRA